VVLISVRNRSRPAYIIEPAKLGPQDGHGLPSRTTCGTTGQGRAQVLRPELSAILGAERFLTEIKTTANLQHPHILSLFDSGEADGLVYYVMPYVEGESLRDRLTREKQLPVEDAVRIATEVGDALEYGPPARHRAPGHQSRRTSCSTAGTRWWRTSASRWRPRSRRAARG